MPAVRPTECLISRREFYKMTLGDGTTDVAWVELIEGRVVNMAIQTELHYSVIALAETVMRQAFGVGSYVRSQAPLNLLKMSVPCPDVCVVAGNIRDHKSHPTAALIIVEVSVGTLGYDRNTKASLYAKAGIGDYWIVNVKRRKLEVRRRPVPDETALFGYSYADLSIYGPGDAVAPMAAPKSMVKVAELLP